MLLNEKGEIDTTKETTPEKAHKTVLQVLHAVDLLP